MGEFNVRIVRLRLQRFRGFAELTLGLGAHVLVVGEPRAGRSDLVAAIERVLGPDSTRAQADPLDIHRSEVDGSVLTEVEVTLVDLDPALEQAFDQALDAVDPATGEVVESGDDGLPPQAVPGLRLCYRLEHDDDAGTTQHWVDYPRLSRPAIGEYHRVPTTLRRLLPFVALRAARPLQLRAGGQFRSILQELDPEGTSGALDHLGADVLAATQALASRVASSSAVDHVLDGVAGLLDIPLAPPSDGVGFLIEDGTVSGLLRSLQPALHLDAAGLLPLSSHGSTAAAVLATAEALFAAAVPGAVVLADDYGDSLDAAAAEYLAASLRGRAGQLWLTTRRPEVARAFPEREMLRLTRHEGTRVVHQLPEAGSKADLVARRHLHAQLLPAMSAATIVLVEGPHDLLGYAAVDHRRLVRDGGLPLAEVGARLVAAGLGGEGGNTAIPAMARLARSLGFRVVALVDHDKPGIEAERDLAAIRADCDAVIRLPPRTAIEKALVQGVDVQQLREAAQPVFDVFGVRDDLSTIPDAEVTKLVVSRLHKGGFHAPLVAALGAETPTPPLAVAALDAVRSAATASESAILIDLSVLGGGS